MSTFAHSPNRNSGNPECLGCALRLYSLDGEWRSVVDGSVVCDAEVEASVVAAVAARDADQLVRPVDGPVEGCGCLPCDWARWASGRDGIVYRVECKAAVQR